MPKKRYTPEEIVESNGMLMSWSQQAKNIADAMQADWRERSHLLSVATGIPQAGSGPTR